MISRRMNQCVFWMMMFVCGVFAVQLGAQPPGGPGEPACGNSCKLISFFWATNFFPDEAIYAFPSEANGPGGCRRIWIDQPNSKDPQGAIVPKKAYKRIDSECASACPPGTTGDVVMTCTYTGIVDPEHFQERNCYVSIEGLPADCVLQP